MIKAFLSYSHDSDEHIAWVEKFAQSLQSIGLSILLDKWHLKFGDDINQFMESSIAEADVVLVICTPEYITKSNSRRGGVGYESVIISSELSGNQHSIKFIPVLRKFKDSVPKLPVFLGNRLYVDMTENEGFGKHYGRLITQLKKLQSNTLKITSSDNKRANGRPQGHLEGPHWVPNQGDIPKNILELMNINNQGLINLEVEDFTELFGKRGFWYACATTEDAVPNYRILTRHVGLQIEAAGIEANNLIALCIAISSPETLTIGDIEGVMEYFETLSASNASIMISSAFQLSGARISLAFQYGNK